MSKSPPNEVTNFRGYMKRLGFYGVSIKKLEQDPNLWAVCAFVRMNEKVPFSRIYSLEDMRCITRAGDIFWRYLK